MVKSQKHQDLVNPITHPKTFKPVQQLVGNDLKTLSDSALRKRITRVLSAEEAARMGLGPWPCKGMPQESAGSEEEKAADLENMHHRAWVKMVGKAYAEPLNLAMLDPCNQSAAKQVFAWANGPKTKSLRIVGDPGTGKTRTASAIIKTLIKEGRSIIRLDGQEFAFFATSAAKNTDDGYEWIKEVCKHDVVFIDDFAKDFRDTTARVSQMIIERMFREEKLLILTTQFSRKMISESLLIGKGERGERVIRNENKQLVESLNRRLSDYFETIRFHKPK